MHSITSDGRRYQLRMDFIDANDNKYYEIYDDFSVGPHNRFELTVGNSYGTAGKFKVHHIDDVKARIHTTTGDHSFKHGCFPI